jgi:hypothetical protein
MTSQSTHLGLLVPTTSDQFSTADIASNWGTIDKYPGTYLCASASRPNSGVGGTPTWNTNHNGMRIRETDTQLEWLWNGTAFIRASPLGRLGGAANAGTVSAATTAVVTATQAANVPIPAGNRWIRVDISWNLIQSTVGGTVLALLIDGTLKQNWSIAGDSTAPSPGAQGSAGSLPYFTQLSAGLHTITMGIRVGASTGGTSSCAGAALTITEI